MKSYTLSTRPFVILVISVLFAFFTACSNVKETTEEEGPEISTYFCGAEKVLENAGKRYFENNGLRFVGIEGQSQEDVFDGEYSIKLDSIHKFGFGSILKNIKVGEYFEISIWKKTKEGYGNIVAVGNGVNNFKAKSINSSVIEQKDGWEKVFLNFTITAELEELNVYFFAGGTLAFVDNIEIKRFSHRPPLDITNMDPLEIVIPDTNYQVLQGYINNAILEKIIVKENKKYVKGYLLVDGDSLPMKIRLKGDWTDHLTGGKISYRIKLAKGYAYKGIRSFSIQHPNTRNYLNEWFAHKLCEKEDILTTTYAFTPVQMNGLNLGVYALEEHFDKQLLESRNRREGPILKMDESSAWAKSRVQDQYEEQLSVPYYESSFVSCFKKNRTVKSPQLSSQFLQGATLLELFKNGCESPENLFDLKKLARYYAIIDVLNVTHGMAWHNRRFYYDPVAGKLEHIAFDLNAGEFPLNQSLARHNFFASSISNSQEGVLDHFIMLNEEFREEYIYCLKRFSSERYMEELFSELDAGLVEQTKLLQSDFKNYRMFKSVYTSKAEFIRNELKTLEKEWDQFSSQFSGRGSNTLPVFYSPRGDDFLLDEISVNAYLSKNMDSTCQVELDNFHVNPIRICGFSYPGTKGEMIPLEKEIELPGIKKSLGHASRIVALDAYPKKVFFSAENIPDSLFSKKLINWSKPSSWHPRIALKNSFKKVSRFYSIEENTVVFGGKRPPIDELIYIPSKYKVKFVPGSTIDFVNGGGLIINNSLEMIGSKDDKIELFSSDGSALGISVLNAEKVEIEHVSLKGFMALNYEGWELTGALTIFETDEVLIDNLSIVDNSSEDALNIIRSHFMINELAIEGTFSDGFDADFCSGTVTSSTFSNTGNDCVDFSGSKITLKDILIQNAGDKGVSAGERSTLTLEKVSIINAEIGIASKDESQVLGNTVDLKNVKIDFMAFVKKPEYDKGSKIDLSKVKPSRVITAEWFELGSNVQINDKTYHGTEKLTVTYP